ncbi:MAG: preprotein translocase subunit SecG [Fimbriimonadales bacterium]
MAVLTNVLTWVVILVAVVFIFLVTIQTTRSEGIFSPGSAEGMYGKAKPGFDDNLSRLTLILAVVFFVLSAVIAYLP